MTGHSWSVWPERHDRIERQEISKVSMMPVALPDTFKEDEILDPVAYFLSRGDRNSPMFK